MLPTSYPHETAWKPGDRFRPARLLDSLWLCRDFILASVQRDFHTRYLGSLLGAGWAVINPLALIIVYTAVFSHAMASKLPAQDGPFSYSIHLCAGLLPWGFFAEVLHRSKTVFVDNANLIKKANFPQIALPAVAVLSAGLNFLIISLLFLAFLAISGNFPGWVLLAIIPVLAVQIVFSVGLGIILGVLNVFFRDVSHAATAALNLWFWVTPIAYPLSILPETLKPFFRLNPMTPLILSYQEILANRSAPTWGSLPPTALLAFLLLWLSCVYFRRNAGEMVDEL